VTLTQLATQQFPRLFSQIKKNLPGFKQAERRPAVDGDVVDDGRNFVIRRESEKLWAKLFPFADIDLNQPPGQLRLFEKRMIFWPLGVGA
jgi:hypothetical protein